MNKAFDENVEREIKKLINKKMGQSVLDIKVQCKDGYVTLTGVVDSLYEKSRVEELAKRINGIKGIENCITVSTNGIFNDNDIEHKIMDKFDAGDRSVPAAANVAKGVAVLEGKVNTLKDKNYAIKEASKVMGVKDVVSHLKIETVGKVDDVTINNRIQQQMVNHGLDRNDIRVEVHDGSVKLSGYVDTKDDMESAIEIAEGTEGVKNIQNSLEIRE